MDTIHRIVGLAHSATSRGGVALAVFLDIANAINSLPWATIRRTLTRFRIPEYLCRVIDDYLSDKIISFNTEGAKNSTRKLITRGDPQCLVEPLLWILGFDY